MHYDREYVQEISGQGYDSPVACVSGSHDTEHMIYAIDAGAGDSVIELELSDYEPGGSPLHTFEGFKAALLADDVQMALGFFTELAALEYEPILEELRPYFDDMVNDMGELTLEEMDGSSMVYELEELNHTPVRSYPVRFNKDKGGYWKISFF